MSWSVLEATGNKIIIQLTWTHYEYVSMDSSGKDKVSIEFFDNFKKSIQKETLNGTIRTIISMENLYID